jgi:nanoRNase/pAp phosphatase (c-di-AMP/oligoRNAs hydrolase)
MYSEHADGFVHFGLRSHEDGDVDVSAIAKRYPNGGGHKHAAGFELKYEYARLVIDSILGLNQHDPYVS